MVLSEIRNNQVVAKNPLLVSILISFYLWGIITFTLQIILRVSLVSSGCEDKLILGSFPKLIYDL